MGLSSEVLDAPGEVETRADEWDALAVAAARPFAAPAWALAWWRELSPDNARLRLVLVSDGERLVGVAPFYAIGRRHRTLGGGLAPVEPLAEPGREQEVATATATALARSSPRPSAIEVEAHDSSPPWPGLLAGAWPGRRGAGTVLKADTPVPRAEFGQGFDAWLGERRKETRRELRRKRRKLEEDGARFRYATADSLERDVRRFMQLHRGRLHEAVGETSLDDPRIERFLVDVGTALLGAGRFRLLCLDLDDQTIAAQLLLVAGGEVSAWNSGFDPAHARRSPSMLCIAEALGDAAEDGGRTMSLGPGAQAYKYRLADQADDDALKTVVVVPRTAGYPLVAARLLPARLRRILGRRLSPGLKRRLRRFRRPSQAPRSTGGKSTLRAIRGRASRYC